MITYEYSEDELDQDSIRDKLHQLHDIPLKFKHRTICFKTTVSYNKKKSQTCVKVNQQDELSDSSSSSDDSSEIQVSEFDISDENKKSNILCQYKNSFFNEKIKQFNEIKSKKVWQGKLLNKQNVIEDQSIKYAKSPSIHRQQSPISENNQNTLSIVRKMKDVNEHSFDTSLKQINSPLLFYLSNINHQSINNNTNQNNTSQNLITQNRSNHQSQNNSLYTIDLPCNESVVQQSSIKLNEKDILNQIIEAIFNRNIQILTKIVVLLQKEYRNDILNLKDMNGNTPLFLAIKLQFQQNQFDIIRLLLSNGADPSIKDSYGWSPIEETVSQMDIITTSLLFDYLVNKKIFDIQQERNQIDQELLKINDFYVEMKWEFKSNLIPFISKFTPNDTFKIYKKGSSLRLDSTFAGTRSYKTKRRDLSVVYNPLQGSVQRKENSSNCQFVIILNRTKKIYYYPIQEIDQEEKKQILLDLLHCESISGEMKVTDCQLIKSKNIFGNYINQKIGNWNCQKYEFRVSTSQTFNKKKQQNYFMTFDQYINQSIDQNLTSARFNIDSLTQQFASDNIFGNSPIQKKESTHYQSKLQNQQTGCESVNSEKKQYKSCSLFISQQFPLMFNQFLPMINMLAKGNEFIQQLQTILSNPTVREVLNDKGFPVKIEIPLNFTVDAVVTFQAYKTIDHEDNEIKKLFQVPQDYSFMMRRDATKVMKREKKRLVLANLFL